MSNFKGDKGGTIRNHRRGGGGKNFSVDEFFFLVQIVCMNFFFNVIALHDFFFDSTLLKKCKASHSLITVLLKVTVSLES